MPAARFTEVDPDGERAPDEPAEPTETADQDGPSRLARALTQVVAPTTLVTSLMFFFGWSHAYWFFDYYGVNSTVLGLTTTDYVMRSVDGLFVPGAVLAAAVLATYALHVTLWPRLPRAVRARLQRRAGMSAGWLGLALTAFGMSRLFVTTALNDGLAVAPLSLAAGVLLVSWALHGAGGRQRRTTDWSWLAQWATVFVLVGLSLFWAANDYSAAVGRSRAQQFERELSVQPQVVVFSTSALGLHGPGVRVQTCAGTDGAYRYRYDGLVLVLHSGDQSVLLPVGWTSEDGVAIVLGRTSTVRLEFVQPWADEAARHPTC